LRPGQRATVLQLPPQAQPRKQPEHRAHWVLTP
jgi:hypothetical protein